MTQDQVATCVECGGKNRVRTSALGRGARARCGYCGSALPMFGDRAEVSVLRPAVIERGGRVRAGAGRWLFGFLVGAIATAVALYFVDRNTDLQRIEIDGTALEDLVDRSWSRVTDFLEFDEQARLPAPDQPPDAPAPAEPQLSAEPVTVEDVERRLIPVPVAPGVLFNWTGREGLAPLNVLTEAGQDYFIKLVDSATGQTAVGIYVKGGSTAEYDVPLGSYEIRYASGSTWYGTQDLFGPGTAYARAAETFVFREQNGDYAGYTLRLAMSGDGNLETYRIRPEAF